MYYYLLWLALAGLILFILYGHDKARSKRKGPRVPEKTFHLLALLGGFIGGWVGRSVFHHKTKKGIFVFVLVVSTMIHVGVVWWMWI